jgi:hypothetical protein
MEGLLMVLAALVASSVAIQLEGSQISYAKFNAWSPCLENTSTLSFKFRTEQSNALLFYSDDITRKDYLELKLVAGGLRLRLRGSGQSAVVSVGSGLGDGLWHRVEVKTDARELTVSVDSIRQSRNHVDFQIFSTNSSGFAYVGGIPIGFSAKLSALSLPSVVFEPRLRGGIQDLSYSNCGEAAVKASMLDNVGVRTNDRQSCSVKNSCLNHGVCVSTDTGSICDCSATNYEGQFCQHGKCMYTSTVNQLP